MIAYCSAGMKQARCVKHRWLIGSDRFKDADTDVRFYNTDETMINHYNNG